MLAHPDDESPGFGGALAAAAASGVETHLITATRGERGRIGEDTGRRPHRVSKPYWLAWTEAKWAADRFAFGDLVARVVDEVRRAVPWPVWAVTTVLDTEAHREQVWRAVSRHR